MDQALKTHLANLKSADRNVQGNAFQAVLEATQGPVDWAYEVWDDLLAALAHKDNRLRSIASQILANLAISDPQERMLDDFDGLLNVTRDERFVTARHGLLSLWKVGLAGPQQQKRLIEGLATRFHECSAEKNCTLIRYDINETLRKLFDANQDPSIRDEAFAWNETEPDLKYRKKYGTVWKRK